MFHVWSHFTQLAIFENQLACIYIYNSKKRIVKQKNVTPSSGDCLKTSPTRDNAVGAILKPHCHRTPASFDFTPPEGRRYCHHNLGGSTKRINDLGLKKWRLENAMEITYQGKYGDLVDGFFSAKMSGDMICSYLCYIKIS